MLGVSPGRVGRVGASNPTRGGGVLTFIETRDAMQRATGITYGGIFYAIIYGASGYPQTLSGDGQTIDLTNPANTGMI